MAPAVIAIPHVESAVLLPAPALPPPNSDKEPEVCAAASQEQDISRSRSVSREPAGSPEKSHHSEDLDEEGNAASPVQPLPEIPSPADGGKPTSSPQRSTSVKEKSRSDAAPL